MEDHFMERLILYGLLLEAVADDRGMLDVDEEIQFFRNYKDEVIGNGIFYQQGRKFGKIVNS